MKDKLSYLVRHSLVYGLGNALMAAGSFILIPLYTHVLSTAEYGILELLNRSADVLMLVMFLGVRQAFIRFYFEKENPQWQRTVIATTVLLISISSLSILLLLFHFREVLAGLLFKSSGQGFLFGLLLAWLPCELFLGIGLTYLQVRMFSVKYILVSTFKLLLIITSNLVLLLVYKKGLVGILISNIWIAAAFTLVFGLFFISWRHFEFSLVLVKELTKFGLPFLPAAFFMFVLYNSDRYILTHYCSLEDVGIYSLGYKVGFFGIFLFMDSVQKVWVPFLFSNYGKVEGPALVSRVFMLLFIANVSLGLLVAIFGAFIVQLISSAPFHSATRVIPVVCLAAIFLSMAFTSEFGILISKKTYYKVLVSGVGSLIGVGMNILLIPKYGIMGAAFSFCLACFSLLAGNLVISLKYYPISVEYLKIGILLFIGGGTYFISAYFSALTNGAMLKPIVSLVCFCAFPICLWLCHCFQTHYRPLSNKLLADHVSTGLDG